MSQASGQTTPHPTIISTTRLIRHYEHGRKTATPTMCAILMMSGYNRNKHATARTEENNGETTEGNAGIEFTERRNFELVHRGPAQLKRIMKHALT
jgi:hypothetical protein